ncbi:unnamed protein product [Ilex paraguariensis]|uniref:Leucine-rich repeat-containing N-terminal plant-type domain-containing protein n=1 Tax=Ilex paraguariensis TaxID=185542 RepID=A0ABC8UF19_9AQUA
MELADDEAVYTTALMRSQALIFLLFGLATLNVECNLEVDSLYAWKTNLVDPNNALQSWDPTLDNPCTWSHITCNTESSVSTVDLGNAGLSGTLVPHLGLLPNLQYLNVSGNKLSGTIPRVLDNLTGLISLDLQQNQLSGIIPPTLGNLRRLNSNQLTGEIPTQVILLIFGGNLRIM